MSMEPWRINVDILRGNHLRFLPPMLAKKGAM